MRYNKLTFQEKYFRKYYKHLNSKIEFFYLKMTKTFYRMMDNLEQDLCLLGQPVKYIS